MCILFIIVHTRFNIKKRRIGLAGGRATQHRSAEGQSILVKPDRDVVAVLNRSGNAQAHVIDEAPERSAMPRRRTWDCGDAGDEALHSTGW